MVKIDNCKKNNYTVFKSAKKGQSSFRITSKLLRSIYIKARKIQKSAEIVITISDKSETYTLHCSLSKEN